MSELADLRQQREEELKKQAVMQQQQKQQEFEAEQKLNGLTNFLLTESARTRLNNVKLVNKELYLKVVQYLLLFYQSGKLPGKVSEKDLLEILKKLSEKKEIKITRK